MINPTTDYISNEDYVKVINTIIESFDIEIERTPKQEIALSLVDSFQEYYLSKDIYTFFIPLSLKRLSEEIFSSPHLMDLVLNITDRVSLTILNTVEYTSLVNSIVRAVCINKKDSGTRNNSLIARETNESLYINPEVLKDLLLDNFWLIVVFILITFFHQTEVYKALKTENS